MYVITSNNNNNDNIIKSKGKQRRAGDREVQDGRGHGDGGRGLQGHRGK